MEYKKDFDKWNSQKKTFDARALPDDFNFHEGEIWWMSLGANIGSEIDGKHENFERPGLVIKIISKQTMYILPLTSQIRSGKYHMIILYGERTGSVVFSQARLISSKRLLRKISVISKEQLYEVKEGFIESLR